MQPQAEAFLKFIDQVLDDREVRILEGRCGDGTAEGTGGIDGQMVNYRVAVQTRKDMLRVREEFLKRFGDEAEEEPEPNHPQEITA